MGKYIDHRLVGRPEPDNPFWTNNTFNYPNLTVEFRYSKVSRGAFDSAKNHKRQRRKRQSVTAKREKSQTPKFV